MVFFLEVFVEYNLLPCRLYIENLRLAFFQGFLKTEYRCLKIVIDQMCLDNCCADPPVLAKIAFPRGDDIICQTAPFATIVTAQDYT